MIGREKKRYTGKSNASNLVFASPMEAHHPPQGGVSEGLARV